MMYRGFKQECPNGAVNEDTFKEIYEKFFPYGSKFIKEKIKNKNIGGGMRLTRKEKNVENEEKRKNK